MAALALKLITKSKLVSGIPKMSAPALHCVNLHPRVLSTMNKNKKKNKIRSCSSSLANAELDGRPLSSLSTEEIFSLSTEDIHALRYGRHHKYWRFSFVPPHLIPEESRSRLSLDLPRDELVQEYIKILATVLESEEEAKKKMYSVSTRHHLFFVCNIDLKTAVQLLESIRFCVIEPVSEKDLERENFAETAEPFVDGKAVEYDPKYHKAILKKLSADVVGRDVGGRWKKNDQNKSGDLVAGRCEGKKHTIQT